MDLTADPRFRAGIAHFNAGDFEDAAEAFEELFFEAVREEVALVRVLLQVSTGIHHVERGQLRAAVERLEEGVRVIAEVTDDGGFDLEALAGEVRRVVPLIRAQARSIAWPKITARSGV